MDVGKLRRLALLFKQRLELDAAIEMVLDRALAAACHEDELLNACGACLINGILNERPVNDRQHLFRQGFGGRQKPGSHTTHGKYRLADAIGHEKSRNSICLAPTSAYATFAIAPGCPQACVVTARAAYLLPD